jgi:hypothetical protein
VIGHENVGGRGYGTGMRTRWSGASGRYQARCGEGHCALTGDQATSKLQGEIFTLLNYVIGPGHRDQEAFFRRPTRLDMVFRLPSGRWLVVEYDGAYWHRNQEERDFRKARMVEEAWWDRRVPARSDAGTCTRLVLLHLLHVMCDDFGNRFEEGAVVSFLRSTPRPLLRDDVRCKECWGVASYFLPTESSSTAASRSKRPSEATLQAGRERVGRGKTGRFKSIDCDSGRHSGHPSVPLRGR